MRRVPAARATTAGATTAAVDVSTGLPTNVTLWPGVWTPGCKAAAGTPCSTYGMAAGDRATRTIQVTGSLRRCV